MDEYLKLVRPWKSGPRRELVRTRIFSVEAGSSVSEEGRAGEFFYLGFADFVNVVALTEDRRVVMVEQFRHGIGRVTLEIPGGLVDEGEEPAAACGRELREETGYGGEVTMIGRVSANPAIQNNWVHTGLVRGARVVGDGKLDECEEIGVRLVPLDEVPGLIRSGVIHHSLVVAAFYHLMVMGV